MNLPNKLSVARIVAVPFFLAALMVDARVLGPSPNHDTINAGLKATALLLFVAACLTDWFDGWYARRHNLKTRLGALLDPLADKVLVAAALVALVEHGLLWGWVVALILAREFLVTGLRLVAAAEGVVISADRWGKHKTAWQMAAISAALVLLLVRDLGWSSEGAGAATAWSPDRVVFLVYATAMAVAVVLTVVSGWVYVARHRELMRE